VQPTNRTTLLQEPLTWTVMSVTGAAGLHAGHLPPWVVATFIVLVLWRVLIGWRGARLPARWLRILVVVAVVGGVLLRYRTLNGVDAGTALLSLMAAMKLLETRNARDQLVLLLISYFLVLAAFLYGQPLWLVPVAAAVTWLITATLLRVAHVSAPLEPRAILRLSGRMLLQALPLMLLLFLLFPRIPGPFWALPTPQHASTGLSDEMAPGDITELTLSSDAAFRVRFAGAAPPPSQRYWRGPVLHDFDGYTWRRARFFFAPVQEPKTREPQYDYTLMLEPTDNHWVYALDLPVLWSDGRINRTYDYQLVVQDRISQPATYQLSSRPAYRAALDGLDKLLEVRDTRLPPDRNPKTRALAQRMFAAAPTDAIYVQSVLQLFRDQEFYYTLLPSQLDFDSVDDFLFNTRKGFCAHFASAFTTLMRAAGIPARVVTGYQGGEYNRLGGYYIVRQSDAHAWSEVWLKGRGWVRVDPTAAVAPERIERGTAGVLGDAEPFAERLIRDNVWLANIRYAWDALNTAWRENVVQFSAEKQEDFLRWLHVHEPDWRWLGGLLAGGVFAFLAFLSFMLARELRFQDRDPVQRAYSRFCRRLERRGLRRAAHEGPLDFLARVARGRPDLAQECEPIAHLYARLRYGADAPATATQELVRRVRAFHPGAQAG
jgi:transglutaminase-like putative cysteine protease